MLPGAQQLRQHPHPLLLLPLGAVLLLFLLLRLSVGFLPQGPAATPGGALAQRRARMGSKVVSVFHSPEQLERTLAELGNGSGAEPIFLLFVGNPDLETGASSWCPDCRRTVPLIERTFAAAASPDATLVKVNVGDRQSWKNPQNPYRAPPYGVEGVPTIARWVNGMMAPGSLGETDADDEDALRRLMQA